MTSGASPDTRIPYPSLSAILTIWCTTSLVPPGPPRNRVTLDHSLTKATRPDYPSFQKRIVCYSIPPPALLCGYSATSPYMTPSPGF